ncbi:hypothetical protein GGR13_001896 [Brevundimonas variabilis]|uniref:Secreted protein n=1 Tax=Brevundimonas variabilis TaxID=74312 RepID=A0A7W9FEF8_9CAUL|nr:hypothetical protein [Brevundimonas variabilis]
MSRITLGVVFALALSGTVAAQETSGVAINQMNSDRPAQRASTATIQIDPDARPLVPGIVPLNDRRIARSETTSTSTTPTPQVTIERGQAYFKPDPNVLEPSAEASPALSRRSDGRNTTAAAPSGPDRCDPQRSPQPAGCERVIEARASEFQPPDHQPLSAEQRLLANQRELRPPASDLNAATRRLGNGELDASNVELAVASIALRSSVTSPEEEGDIASAPSAIDAIVAGITTLVTGLPPTP